MKQIYKYGVQTVGIKKKCRKVDFHLTGKNELGKSESIDWQELKRRAENWLLANMKQYDREKTFLTASLWTIEGEVETWQPFTASHNLRKQIDSE